MKESEAKIIESLEDAAHEAIDHILASDQLENLKKEMSKAIERLPQGYSINFLISLQVFDEKRDHSLKLTERGITLSEGEPYIVSGDSTVQRYMVKGEICQVPHDHCPSCWEIWDFKTKNLECSGCGLKMGVEVKMMMDDDICPSCEEGSVTRANPKCDRCGEIVDEALVVWG